MIEIKPIKLNETSKYYKLYEKEGIFLKKINKITSKVCHTPISYLSFRSDDYVFYKGHHGKILSRKADIKNNIDSINPLSNDIFIIPDTHLHQNKAAIYNSKNIRFYAAVPLVSPEGFNIGNLAILDEKPRNLTSNQIQVLKILASLVIDKLETRLKEEESRLTYQQAINSCIHEIKNKNTSISLSAEIIITKIKDQKTVERFAKKIKALNSQVLACLNKLYKLRNK